MRNYSILILIALFISSCSPYYYYPTYQDIPTNSKENEIRVSNFISGSSEGLNISYSLTKNIGTFLTLNTFDGFDFQDGAQIADLGLYYFKNKKIAKNKNIRMTYSLSSAYGYGQNNRYNDSYDMDIHRMFVQPSFAITSKFIDFGVSSRFSYVDYKVDRFVGEQFDYFYDDLFDVGKRKFYFFEPHMYLGLGYKGIKLNYHIVKSSKINDEKISYIEGASYLSLSLKFDIDKIFKK